MAAEKPHITATTKCLSKHKRSIVFDKQHPIPAGHILHPHRLPFIEGFGDVK